MALRANLTTKVGNVFTKVWAKLEGSATSLYLMKVSENYDEYDEVLEIADKRFFEFRNNRQELYLEIGDDSDELTAAMAQATHIKVIDDTEPEIIYAIDLGDTTPPQATDVTWKIKGDLHERRQRYGTLGQ